jgi:hypothetical protein
MILGQVILIVIHKHLRIPIVAISVPASLIVFGWSGSGLRHEVSNQRCSERFVLAPELLDYVVLLPQAFNCSTAASCSASPFCIATPTSLDCTVPPFLKVYVRCFLVFVPIGKKDNGINDSHH